MGDKIKRQRMRRAPVPIVIRLLPLNTTAGGLLGFIVAGAPFAMLLAVVGLFLDVTLRLGEVVPMWLRRIFPLIIGVATLASLWSIWSGDRLAQGLFCANFGSDTECLRPLYARVRELKTSEPSQAWSSLLRNLALADVALCFLGYLIVAFGVRRLRQGVDDETIGRFPLYVLLASPVLGLIILAVGRFLGSKAIVSGASLSWWGIVFSHLFAPGFMAAICMPATIVVAHEVSCELRRRTRAGR